MMVVRQEGREAVSLLHAFACRGRRRGGTTREVHAMKRPDHGRCEENRSVAVPSTTVTGRRIAQSSNSPAPKLDNLQLSIGEEADALVFRSPEWECSSLCTR